MVFRELAASAGKYAAFSNRDVGTSVIRRLGLTNISYAGRERCLSYYLGISTRLKDTDFLKRFDEALRGIEKSGLKRTILAPYAISANDGACGATAPGSPVKESVPVTLAPASAPAPRPDCVVKVEGKDDVIVCSKSCLTWQKSGSDRRLTWLDASESYIAGLNAQRFGAATDWRLPSSEELQSLLTNEPTRENRMFLTPGFDGKQTQCWTADRLTEGGRDEASYVDFDHPALDSKSTLDTNYARAVRGAYCGHR